VQCEFIDNMCIERADKQASIKQENVYFYTSVVLKFFSGNSLLGIKGFRVFENI